MMKKSICKNKQATYINIYDQLIDSGGNFNKYPNEQFYHML